MNNPHQIRINRGKMCICPWTFSTFRKILNKSFVCLSHQPTWLGRGNIPCSEMRLSDPDGQKCSNKLGRFGSSVPPASEPARLKPDHKMKKSIREDARSASPLSYSLLNMLPDFLQTVSILRGVNKSFRAPGSQCTAFDWGDGVRKHLKSFITDRWFLGSFSAYGKQKKP